MDGSDSRKRPLDDESDSHLDGAVTKRSNQGPNESIHLKVLIPAIAAGAVIGKGGETITRIQKEMGANIKMSKAQDFYPGTNERVCLIVGSLESVTSVNRFIMEQIREKPEQNHTTHTRQVEGNQKINFERHKQVKVLVPNSTAGMIIGKNGNFIREIKENSGAFVQLSQKSKEMNLQERCITIAGDFEHCLKAMEMIMQKIADDPQSTSCPNISYADYKGPLASANPTGSPFASGTVDQRMGIEPSGVFNNIGNSMNNLNLNSGQRGMQPPPQQGHPQQGPLIPPPAGLLAGNPAVNAMRNTLRNSGYTEQAIDEIIAAVITLANYGLFGFSVNLGGLGLQQGQGGQGGVTLANLANIMNSQGSNNQGPGGPQMHGSVNGPMAGNMGPGNRMGNNFHSGMNGGQGSGREGNPQVFGPVGSTTTTKAGGDTGEGGRSFYANSGPISGPHGPGGDSVFSGGHDSGERSFMGSNSISQGFSGQNQNSFGLGTDLPMARGSENDEQAQNEIEVGEHIVGAILGPGGKGIIEIQNYTNTKISISKKGVFAPGTRNRVVTIIGNSSGIRNAEYLMNQRIAQEETNRSRKGLM